MTIHTPEGEIPITVRFHQRAVDQLIAAVEQGAYCALLGPRLCGKTVLLRYAENLLSNQLGWTCAYIDFHKINAATQQIFFT
jgi:ABC-type Na+ transport system ATPase subunit NatA